MRRFEDQVVMITGAARGQGRSHAIGFASEGANIIAFDTCAEVEGVPYHMASHDDLETTVEMVRAAGGEIVACVGDVRRQDDLDAAVAAGMAAFGRLDHLVPNAGVFTMAAKSWLQTDDEWNATIDTNLTGVWRTCKAAIPAMIESGGGGSITITSSSNGYRGEHGHPAYNASKLGVVALMRCLAAELGEHSIRVNTIHPTCVKTTMMWSDYMVGLFIPGATTATVDEASWWDGLAGMNMLPVGAMDAADVTEVVTFLASSAGRFITASEIPVDAGYIMKVGR
jgi:(+)-trans-carveol dehydrogenase